MSRQTTTDINLGFGYETPVTTSQPLITEGVLCGSTKLDIDEWIEHPDAL